MPIFEYACQKCGQIFEKLVLGRSQQPPVCPRCGADRIEQQFSTFSTSASGARSAPVCAPSGGG
ncbi:MAG TPA: zinc ribbon domain-containing protein [Terriglobia bacterium]|nr:zinc ribbon domain-containing protein [Terriglobia bacterium]